jgi:hypothetical protein
MICDVLLAVMPSRTLVHPDGRLREGTMPRHHLVRRSVSALALAAVTLAASVAPGIAEPWTGLSGSWSGSGQFRLESGRTEGLRCSAHYAPRRDVLGLSLRCASASNRIELRARLVSRGDRVSGTWEERSYNASGSVSGRATGNSLRLAINGGGLSGYMVVTTAGGSQSISVRTDGAALRGINISLRRR